MQEQPLKLMSSILKSSMSQRSSILIPLFLDKFTLFNVFLNDFKILETILQVTTLELAGVSPASG